MVGNGHRVGKGWASSYGRDRHGAALESMGPGDEVMTLSIHVCLVSSKLNE